MQRWRRDEPPADWLVVWIDLATPNLGYQVSPVTYHWGPAGKQIQGSFAHTTLQFLRESEEPARVDLAVNTVAYWPFPAADGSLVYLSEPVWQASDDRRDPKPQSLMLGLCEGKAIIAAADTVRAARPVCAFGGFLDGGAIPRAAAVLNGEVVSDGNEPHGRTLAGVSADGRVLILVVADCYNPGVSIGLSTGDAARVIQSAGAANAMFFDGGGSSTLVARGLYGQPVVLNRPAGLQKIPGTLRYVGGNLGFTNLVKTSEVLPAIANATASPITQRWAEFVNWCRANPNRFAKRAAATCLGGAFFVVFWRLRRVARTKRARVFAKTLES